MFRTIRSLLEMIRFSHTLFALPFALLAAAMAVATPLSTSSENGKINLTWQAWVGILVCMIGARSAAMAFNRLVDRDIDGQNPRTKMRHLPAGSLSVTQVVLFTLVSCVMFFTGTLLFWPNWLPAALSVPVILFLLGYSLAKRFTALAHFWLGIALGLAPVCVWIALRGNEVIAAPADILPALLLGGAVFTWVSGFDIIYACQDAEFDRGAGLFSVPAKLGVRGALRLAAASHGVTVLLLAAMVCFCPQVPLGWLMWVAITVVAALLIYEHALVSPTDLGRVNTAFFNVNVIISVGLLVVGVADLFWV